MLKINASIIWLLGLTFSCGCGEAEPVEALVPALSGDKLSLNGDWGFDCAPLDGWSARSVSSFDGEQHAYRETVWLDVEDCSGPPSWVSVDDSLLDFGEEQYAALGTGRVLSRRIDGVIVSRRFTVFDPVQATLLSGVRECGIEDWSVGEERELAGTDCLPHSDFKSLVFVDDTRAPHELFLGSLQSSGSPQDYPDSLQPDPLPRM